MLNPAWQRIRELYKPDSSGCWIWTGNVHKINKGGQIWYKGQTRPAYRVVYELLISEVPQDKQLDHLCRNRTCVNPDHLEIVTPAENYRRGNQSKITHKIASEIISLYRQGNTQTSIGSLFGIGQPQISRIVNNKAWGL